MGMPVVSGRACQPRDRADGLPVAVVSSSFAKLLETDHAVGQRLRLAATGGTVWEVVGVVGDVQVAALDTDSPPVIYLTHLQTAENRMNPVLRTDRKSTRLNSSHRTISYAVFCLKKNT